MSQWQAAEQNPGQVPGWQSEAGGSCLCLHFGDVLASFWGASAGHEDWAHPTFSRYLVLPNVPDVSLTGRLEIPDPGGLEQGPSPRVTGAPDETLAGLCLCRRLSSTLEEQSVPSTAHQQLHTATK